MLDRIDLALLVPVQEGFERSVGSLSVCRFRQTLLEQIDELGLLGAPHVPFDGTMDNRADVNRAVILLGVDALEALKIVPTHERALVAPKAHDVVGAGDFAPAALK